MKGCLLELLYCCTAVVGRQADEKPSVGERTLFVFTAVLAAVYEVFILDTILSYAYIQYPYESKFRKHTAIEDRVGQGCSTSTSLIALDRRMMHFFFSHEQLWRLTLVPCLLLLLSMVKCGSA